MIRFVLLLLVSCTMPCYAFETDKSTLSIKNPRIARQVCSICLKRFDPQKYLDTTVALKIHIKAEHQQKGEGSHFHYTTCLSGGDEE